MALAAAGEVDLTIGGISWRLGAVMVLVLLNGFFVAAEFALACREISIKHSGKTPRTRVGSIPPDLRTKNGFPTSEGSGTGVGAAAGVDAPGRRREHPAPQGMALALGQHGDDVPAQRVGRHRGQDMVEQGGAGRGVHGVRGEPAVRGAGCFCTAQYTVMSRPPVIPVRIRVGMPGSTAPAW